MEPGCPSLSGSAHPLDADKTAPVVDGVSFPAIRRRVQAASYPVVALSTLSGPQRGVPPAEAQNILMCVRQIGAHIEGAPWAAWILSGICWLEVSTTYADPLFSTLVGGCDLVPPY